MEDQEYQECRMILLLAWERGKRLPVGRIIVIARQEKARDYAERQLKPYLPKQSVTLENRYMFTQKDLGSIFLWPNPETIFLYIEEVGRIK